MWLVRSLKKVGLAICIVLLGAQSAGAQTGSSWLLDFNENGIYQYRNVPLGGGCSTNGLQELLGHKLPATRGGTGFEEEINDQGRVRSKWDKPESEGGYIAFSQTLREASSEPVTPGGPSLKQLYMDYYINMRWNYTALSWDGDHSGPGTEDKEFYATAPRVLVTNPATGKSIIAVVLEYGPAPWTGVDYEKNNEPKQGWVNPMVGTPENYRGRVSGFPPKAIEALGATQRMQDGTGHDLIYSWAPDQRALPGPVDATSSNVAAAGASLCSGGTVVIDGLTYAFPVEPQTRINYSNLPCANRTGCHHDGTSAFDLMYGEYGALDGKAVYAITDGTIVNVTIPYLLPEHPGPPHPECRALQLKAAPAYQINGQDIFFWYGHMKNVTVEPGEEVKAGDKIGEVADYSFGSACRGGRDHLHIDRGTPGHHGGSVCCRDPNFVDFLNNMHSLLPEGGGGI